MPEYFFQKNITIERVKQTPQLLTIKYIPIEKDRLQADAKYTYSDGSAIKGRRIDFTYTKDGRKYRKNYSVTNNEGEIRFNIRLNEEKPDKQKLTAPFLIRNGSSRTNRISLFLTSKKILMYSSSRKAAHY